MEQLAVAPAVMRKRVEETLDLLGLADLRRPRAARAVRRPAAARGHRRRCSPPTRASSCSTSPPPPSTPPRPKRCWPPSPASCTTSASPSCWPSTGSSGWCSTPTGSSTCPATARSADGSPAVDVRDDDGRAARRRAGPPARVGAAAAVGARRPAPGRRRCATRSAPHAVPAPRVIPAAGRRVALTAQGRGRALRRRRRRARGRPRPDVGTGHRADGPQRLGQVVAAVGAAGLRARASAAGSTSPAATPRALPAAAARALGRAGAADPGRPALPRPRSAPNSPRPTASRAPSATSARELLDRLAPGIPDDLHPRDLSEGQRLSLVLAVQLRATPQVVLLDEPTRGLDYPAKQALIRIVDGLAAEGRAVVDLHARRRVRRRGRRPGRRDGRGRDRGRRPDDRRHRRVAGLRPADGQDPGPAAVPHRGAGRGRARRRRRR